jgi:large subunit ribosomal protein L21
MFAIIRSGGKQFKVTEGMHLKVPTLSSKVGEEVTFSEVLLLTDGTNRYTGTPTVKGAKVTGVIIRHGRDDKQVIYKYKRRKNFHMRQGHRQGFTEVEIKSIGIPSAGAKKKAAPKVEEKTADKEKVSAPPSEEQADQEKE